MLPNKPLARLIYLKGQYHEIFYLWFFHQTSPPRPLIRTKFVQKCWRDIWVSNCRWRCWVKTEMKLTGVNDTAESVKTKFCKWSSAVTQQCHWHRWDETQWCHWHRGVKTQQCQWHRWVKTQQYHWDRWISEGTAWLNFIGSHFISRENQTKFKQGWNILFKALEEKS